MTVAPSRATQMPVSLEEALSYAQGGQLDRARAALEAICAAEPANASARVNLGAVHCMQANFADGAARLEEGLALNPADEAASANLYNAYSALLSEAKGRDDKPAAIEAMRRIIALRPEESAQRVTVENYLAYTGASARLSDYEPSMSAGELGRTILIACMPKSGSSWLVNAVRRLSGFGSVNFANAFVENEQEIYAPAVHETARQDKVVQQHCRASAPNIHLIQAYGMKPVVLVRNLFDTLVSMRDFWDEGAVRNSFLYPDWHSLDRDAKHDALVRHLAPWYVQFFVSWAIAERQQQVSPLWVRYEEMIPAKAETLSRVAGFCGLPADPAGIEAAIARVDGDRYATRFNKGVAGRGDDAFTGAQKDMVRALTGAFPSIDFGPIGL